MFLKITAFRQRHAPGQRVPTEPAWHSALRRRRAVSRAFLRVASGQPTAKDLERLDLARRELNQHHGSMAPRQRRYYDNALCGGPKEPHWLCDRCGCKSNFACRVKCFQCTVPAPRSIVDAAWDADKKARAQESPNQPEQNQPPWRNRWSSSRARRGQRSANGAASPQGTAQRREEDRGSDATQPAETANGERLAPQGAAAPRQGGLDIAAKLAELDVDQLALVLGELAGRGAATEDQEFDSAVKVFGARVQAQAEKKAAEKAEKPETADTYKALGRKIFKCKAAKAKKEKELSDAEIALAEAAARRTKLEEELQEADAELKEATEKQAQFSQRRLAEATEGARGTPLADAAEKMWNTMPDNLRQDPQVLRQQAIIATQVKAMQDIIARQTREKEDAMENDDLDDGAVSVVSNVTGVDIEHHIPANCPELPPGWEESQPFRTDFLAEPGGRGDALANSELGGRSRSRSRGSADSREGSQDSEDSRPLAESQRKEGKPAAAKTKAGANNRNGQRGQR